ncbi:hypothetical protein FH972_021818 [Carpinus fangiana]|uniref:RRM domain-containing protein n=1 Tax=Carpinus fangiana TaxID=176857 RepID=A0A5N6KR29_9ROSI|nr:hypothetical protein FH972_021818 [Carpinus fangiana]
MTTVHVKNIATETTETQVRDFFSFCGKISSLNLSKDGATQSADVTFEKPTAGKTALLLNDTQLGPNVVTVTSDASLEKVDEKDVPVGESPATGANISHDNDVDQEDKPRSRIVAEYLAHGYVISDKAIERALALDTQHGISHRFTTALKQFDDKYNATGRAQAVDEKYGITEKANQGWRTMYSYFDKAAGTPTGHKVNSFYQVGSKQVIDVHNEARRLADMKSGKHAAEPVSGTDKTHCGCGGENATCGCQPGKCACASCPKNADAAASEKPAAATSS